MTEMKESTCRNYVEQTNSTKLLGILLSIYRKGKVYATVFTMISK